MLYTAIFLICTSPQNCFSAGQNPVRLFPSREACEAALPAIVEVLEAQGAMVAADCHAWGRGQQV